ncbi:MAG: hypothetical protein AAGC88_15565 [Bacteroidota bacterium]
MKLRLLVAVSLGLTFSCQGYSQHRLGVDEFQIADFTVVVEKLSMVETEMGVCEMAANLVVSQDAKELYRRQICGVEISDVEVIQKGYLTIVDVAQPPKSGVFGSFCLSGLHQGQSMG